MSESASGLESDVNQATASLTRRRLDHVDAMRPLKQIGVVSTHVLLNLGPPGVLAVGATEMLTHFTREGFLFLSACMLTYSYRDIRSAGWRRFYKRRFIAVAIPYLCWTLIYFFLRILIPVPGTSFTALGELGHLGYLVLTGYYHLYYLVVIMEFYLVFPVVVWLLRRTEGHHRELLAASFLLQLVLVSMVHWGRMPGFLNALGNTRAATLYQLYLIGGAVVAWHLDAVDRWMRSHVRTILASVVVTIVAAETVYTLAATKTVPWLGSASTPVQPIVVPYYAAAIASLYLLGIWLVGQRRSRWIRSLVRRGSDNSYGIYLAQMLFIVPLSALGWQELNRIMPWPLVTVITVALVIALCVLLTSILARTPLAQALTGRPRQSWSSWLPRVRATA